MCVHVGEKRKRKRKRKIRTSKKKLSIRFIIYLFFALHFVERVAFIRTTLAQISIYIDFWYVFFVTASLIISIRRSSLIIDELRGLFETYPH